MTFDNFSYSYFIAENQYIAELDKEDSEDDRNDKNSSKATRGALREAMYKEFLAIKQ